MRRIFIVIAVLATIAYFPMKQVMAEEEVPSARLFAERHSCEEPEAIDITLKVQGTDAPSGLLEMEYSSGGSSNYIAQLTNGEHHTGVAPISNEVVFTIEWKFSIQNGDGYALIGEGTVSVDPLVCGPPPTTAPPTTVPPAPPTIVPPTAPTTTPTTVSPPPTVSIEVPPTTVPTKVSTTARTTAREELLKTA